MNIHIAYSTDVCLIQQKRLDLGTVAGEELPEILVSEALIEGIHGDTTGIRLCRKTIIRHEQKPAKPPKPDGEAFTIIEINLDMVFRRWRVSVQIQQVCSHTKG